MMAGSFMDIYQQAGITKFPLILCSVWGLTLVIQGFLYLYVNRVQHSKLDLIKSRFLSSGKSACLHELRSDRSVPCKVMAHALTLTHLDKADITEDLGHFLQKEISGIDRSVAFISAIVTAAPMLGLFGTVLGIIKIFGAMSGAMMNGDVSMLSVGISESLITTAAGLCIAIPLIFFHQYLSNRIDAYLSDLEQMAHELVLFCQTNTQGAAG
jgi:biopolymer transport protein ExbB